MILIFMRADSRLDRLGDGTDLVNLEQETVASLLLDGTEWLERFVSTALRLDSNQNEHTS